MQPPSLSNPTRWLSGILGTCLLAASAIALYKPPTPHTVKYDNNNKQVIRTSTPSDLTSIVIAVGLAGAGLVLYGLNGYRFTRVAAGSVGANSEAFAEGAKKQIAADSGAASTIKIDKSAAPDPSPTQAPTATIETNNEAYAVYELLNVPSQVVEDALANWPPEHRKPSTLADFEYASRKKGQGNHSWQLKFRGVPAVLVSYGGYAKSSVTVRPEESA